MSNQDRENRRLRERDLYAWSKATELLLFHRRIHEIDWDAVGDELETSAQVNDANPMREAVEKLLTHLTIWNASLKNHRSARRSEIEAARSKIDETLSRSPSLAGLIDLEWKTLDAHARFAAALILGDRATLREPPVSRLTLVTDDEPESETESIALMRLSIRVARLKLHVATTSRIYGNDSNLDHYAWCRAQAAAARSRKFDELDPVGIAEEISRAGNSVRLAVIQSLARLLEELMAWQKEPRSPVLKTEIASERARVRALLWKNPSLATTRDLVTEAYLLAMKHGEGSDAACESIALRSRRWKLADLIDDAAPIECEPAFAAAAGLS